MTEYQDSPLWLFRWIVLSVLFTIHSSLFVSPAGAQSFTQDIQKTVKGEGTVTIHQSKEIDELVNAPAAPAKKSAATTPKQDNTTDKSAAKSALAQTTTATTEPADKADDDMPVTTTTHRTRRVTGYRVQAFAGGNTRADRQKAEQTANAIRSLFPGEQVYTHFYNPRWICRVGNYATYEEAHNMLTELRKLGYSSATIVKGKVMVAY